MTPAAPTAHRSGRRFGAICHCKFSRSASISDALGYRASRFFSSAFLMTASSLAGTLGFTPRAGSGTCLRMASRSAGQVSPVNARLPVASS